MKLEEIQALALDEVVGVLRKPYFAQRASEQEIMQARKIMSTIVLQVIENPHREWFLNSLLGKTMMHDAGIKHIKKIDDVIGFYEIDSDFGKGVFFDSHRLFPDGKYPEWLVPGRCYSNCDGYVIHSNLKCEIVSGIGFLEKPFLHSIILTKSNQVVDFNYNVVMSADLYFKLMNFEVFAKLDSKNILKNKELFLNGYEHFGNTIQSWELNFAFDDVMESINHKLQTTNSKVGEII